MIDRLQKQRTRRVRAFAAGFFVFPGKTDPRAGVYPRGTCVAVRTGSE